MMITRRYRGYGLFVLVPILAALALTSCATPSVQFDTPEGFARYVEEGRQGAVSPEGVILSAYRTANEPQQDLAFWAEAVELHLADGGYLLLHTGEFETASLDGRYFEWVAPLGEDDWVYLTAFCVDDGAIAVVEAAGPYDVYGRYRDGIRESLQTVRIR
jgi:hypothetical protein